ncbi:MAG: alpha/beta fold hydrolase [Chroococcidiopsis sp.]
MIHNNVMVNGIQLHYVTAGEGEPLILLHGYPQTHHAWHKVIPELARHFTVIAPDLRGLGDSERPKTGYEKHIIAEDIYQLVRSLGYEKIYLVGHDYGGSTAYFLASEHPEIVQRLIVIECAPPGLGESSEVPLIPGGGAWHRAFHLVPELPEALVAGRERVYLSWLYQHYSRNHEAISDADIDEYVRTYSQPGAMKAGFEYYRAYFKDTERGQEYAKTKLQMPVLAIGADSVYGASVEQCMKRGAINVEGIVIANCGHFVPEEQPEALIEYIFKFAMEHE